MAEVSSLYSASSTTTTTPTGWFLKDPFFPALNMVAPIQTVSFAKEIDQAVFSPLGRTRNVVIQDVQRGETISAQLVFTTQALYNQFEALRGALRTLLLQSDANGEQWYVRFGSARQTTLANTTARLTNPFRTVSAEFIEVDEPA